MEFAERKFSSMTQLLAGYKGSFIYLNLFFMALVLFVTFALLFGFFENKVGFIRSRVIFEEYQGMKDAKQMMQQQRMYVSKYSDSLKLCFNTKLEKFGLGNIEGKENIKLVLLQEQKAIQSQIEEKQKILESEENRISKGIVTRVNEGIKAYALNNNYRIILGTTESGNVLYGDDNLDITMLVLEELNRNYSTASKK